MTEIIDFLLQSMVILGLTSMCLAFLVFIWFLAMLAWEELTW